jgi:vitamin B12 transporter
MTFRLTRAGWLAALPLAVLASDCWGTPSDLDRVVVSTSPTGSMLVDSLESVTIIGRDDIEAMPVATLADLLDQVAGVDIRRRGATGVQADIGIRGTAYEQTLVLIDGIPLKDPQTGHHDLNLPVPLEHIERIEVVRGPGGLAWGGSATGGLVNIITRRASGREYGLGLRAGSFSTREIRGHAGTGDERGGHLVSASGEFSDGHLPESRADADLRRAMYTGHVDLDNTVVTWGLGAENKEFGAWKFYTADFPDQREETASRLAYLSARGRAGGWETGARLFWRGHEDWFRTRVGGTDFINEHETDVYGFHLDGRRTLGTGTFAMGAGSTLERIASNALDNHRRSESSLWAAHRQPVGPRLNLEAGLSAVRFSEAGSEWLPSLALGYRISPDWHAHLSSARSARVPSWTERHLLTGGNVGNPELLPERSTLHEAGLRYSAGRHRLAAAVFERRTDRLIDWSRGPGEVTWRADNFEGHRGRGAELEWYWRPAGSGRLQSLSASWTGLSTRLDDRGQAIKYALDYPRHAWTAGGLFDLGGGISLSIQARLVERGSGNRGTLVAARVQRRFGDVQLYVEGSNLLDEEIVEAGFDSLPGRAVFAGLSWSVLR